MKPDIPFRAIVPFTVDFPEVYSHLAISPHFSALN